MTDIQLIALDMDGTLLNDQKEVPKRNRDAIEQALEQDVHVVLSTGRGIRRCYSIAKDLRLSSYLVTANGAEIWTMEKERLQQSVMKTELVEKIYNLAIQAGAGVWMISSEGAFQGDTIPEDFYQYDWLKFGCYSADKQTLDILVKEFSNYEELEIANSLPTNIEVNAKGVTKANALSFLCERIGITMDQVLACGDSLNDLKMIQAAGVGAAMDNAQDAIKQVADFVTKADNNNGGVGEAIERYVLGR